MPKSPLRFVCYCCCSFICCWGVCWARDSWKGLSDAEKVPYQRENEKDKLRYAAELALYESGTGKPRSQFRSTCVQSTARSRRSAREARAGARRPRSCLTTTKTRPAPLTPKTALDRNDRLLFCSTAVSCLPCFVLFLKIEREQTAPPPAPFACLPRRVPDRGSGPRWTNRKRLNPTRQSFPRRARCRRSAGPTGERGSDRVYL